MKYVISDKGEVNVGERLHIDLAKEFKGKVVRAGQCEKLEDGWTVFGKSYGYGIEALNSDRDYLNEQFND